VDGHSQLRAAASTHAIADAADRQRVRPTWGLYTGKALKICAHVRHQQVQRVLRAQLQHVHKFRARNIKVRKEFSGSAFCEHG